MSTKPAPEKRRRPPEFDDTAMLSLSKVDRKKLGMDSWEPSLLRKLLAAQNRLNTKK